MHTNRLPQSLLNKIITAADIDQSYYVSTNVFRHVAPPTDQKVLLDVGVKFSEMNILVILSKSFL